MSDPVSDDDMLRHLAWDPPYAHVPDGLRGGAPESVLINSIRLLAREVARLKAAAEEDE
jgi:hypothetical protein